MIDNKRLSLSLAEEVITLSHIPDMNKMDEVVDLYVLKKNIVAVHASVQKKGLTVLYTTDGKTFLVKEDPMKILIMK